MGDIGPETPTSTRQNMHRNSIGFQNSLYLRLEGFSMWNMLEYIGAENNIKIIIRKRDVFAVVI